MAELADALDLGSSGETRKSSSLFTRTTLRVCDATGGGPPVFIKARLKTSKFSRNKKTKPAQAGPILFNTPDNYVGNLARVPNRTLHRNRPEPARTTQPYKPK